MFTHLVILGSTVTALAVVRDAHAHGLRPIVVDTGDGIAFRSRYAIACRPADASDEAVLAALRAHAGPGSALVATGDPWVRFVIRQRPALDGMFGAVLHPVERGAGDLPRQAALRGLVRRTWPRHPAFLAGRRGTAAGGASLPGAGPPGGDAARATPPRTAQGRRSAHRSRTGEPAGALRQRRLQGARQRVAAGPAGDPVLGPVRARAAAS